MNDMEDVGFVDGMKQLLGIDKEAVEGLIDSLDNESLAALTDAIAKRDKEAATTILQSFNDDVDVNSLFRGDDIPEKDEKKVKKKKKPVKPPKDHVFGIGDDVAVKTPNEDTGEDEFISATVFQPNAPGDTIGVKIKGRAKMVEKDDLYALNEMGVMGMVSIPNIQRMQQLAGIPSEPMSQEPVRSQPSLSDDMDAVQQASCALDALEHALPNVRLGDLKMIRQRILAMQTSMNESIREALPMDRARK